ncbi:tetratricopeptide repeat protein [Stieleria mannarensis]|uniref:tetratricopeptide repeat protein n=1 Tax=Stieleria mannarensis TaxID=2755585 RepID=UPI0015FF005F|nr:tetratricopeptide repeat protein [Rhodopirellula sp. JC639]
MPRTPTLNRYTIPACLIALSLAVYLQTTGFQFVALDDAEYVSRNPNVQNGINAADATWALTTTRMGNWHPLVWWSFQLDSQLYGNGPLGFHLTNVILHTLSVVVLFVALKVMGLRDTLAATVAVLFCVHPLNVESVAWVAERKGTLSTLFWMLGMLAYAHYARRPTPHRMGTVFLCMAAGLMSKPSLLTFPFAMMLLDIWPLCRIRFGESGESGENLSPDRLDALLLNRNVESNREPISLLRSALEKAPLLLLSLVFSFVALSAQQSTGAVASLDAVPLGERLLQIPCAYLIYLWHLLMPIGLTVGVLPPRDGMPVGFAIFSAAILTGISIYCWRNRRRIPILFVGWFWFLGTMFPTSGIVPIGIQWMADRYTYVPNVGLFLLIGAVIMLAIDKRSISSRTLIAFAALSIATFSTLSLLQARHWQDSNRLFTRMLQIDPDNHLAHSNLSAIYLSEGSYPKAFSHAQAAIDAGLKSATTRNNLALCKAKLGRRQEAMEEFAKVIEIDPQFAQAYLNLGNLLRTTNVSQAEACYRKAITVDPEYAEAHNNLGGLLASRNPAEAQRHLKISLKLWPENPDANANLGNAYARLGDYENAIRFYRRTLQLQPNHPVAVQNLAVVTKLDRDDATE